MQANRGALIASLKGAVVASCQAGPESSLNQPLTIAALTQGPAVGGADVRITSTLEDAVGVVEAGADCFEGRANAVIIGSAITVPELITPRFVAAARLAQQTRAQS